MIQLILDTKEYNVSLPESKNGGYQVERQALSVEVEMVTGRIVRELRGNVWVVLYQYGYFDDETKNLALAACEKGRKQPIRCGFLPQESVGTLNYADFFVTSFSRPKFLWSSKETAGHLAVPIWGDFSLELREVRPSD